MKRWVRIAGFFVAPVLLAGCNAIVGLRDIDLEGAATTSDASVDRDVLDGGDGGDAGDAAVAPGDGGDAGDAAVAPGDGGLTALSGALHFLQTPSSLTIATGLDTITLTANGAFTLPVHTSSYDVAITSQPAGQECWVQNGKGTTAAPVTGLEVRCKIIKSSVGTAVSARTTTSASYEPIDDVADLVIENDIAASTLLFLSVPTVNANTQPFLASQHRVGIFVDGLLQAEAVTRVHFHGFWNDTPIVVLAVPVLPAGTHTIKAQWRRVDGSDDVFRSALSNSNGPLRTELGAVVLDSLSMFDRIATSISTAQTTVSALNTDSSIGIPSLAFNSTVQPALLLASVPDLSGQQITKLQVDGTTAAYHRYVDNDANAGATTSPTPMVMQMMSAGAHTLDARVNGLGGGGGVIPTYGASAGSNAVKTAALMAMLWKPAATSASWSSAAAFEVLGASANVFKQGGNAISITTTKASKALVMMDLTRIAATDNAGSVAPAEASIFVGGTQGPTVLVGRGGWDDEHRSNITTRLAIVDVPAGTTSIDLRFRNYAGIRTHVIAARYGVVVLD